ncbi:MAG TPA: hypothetical protein VJU59_38305 [Paraburkholderia sp.]|uniref:hypothetical protein n=1 Tax=Paraburkholderia sp. TaxID=1926495 RepID=UPI002B45E7FD|nr:hypothetical protein [Paraburkholderia sp.]HKR45462.1 hypothetical protein [Paraburkholderia sp.]
MTQRVYRAFLLTGPGVWRHVVEVVKAHARAFIERDKPLMVIICSQEHDATDSQRAYWQGVVLPRIAEEIPDEDGEMRPAAWWHEKLVLEFFGMTETVSGSGKIRRQRKSTARGKITVGEFADLINRTEAWAASLGVEWG